MTDHVNTPQLFCTLAQFCALLSRLLNHRPAGIGGRHGSADSVTTPWSPRILPSSVAHASRAHVLGVDAPVGDTRSPAARRSARPRRSIRFWPPTRSAARATHLR